MSQVVVNRSPAVRPTPALGARLTASRKGFWLPGFVVLALIVFFSVETPSFATIRNVTALSSQAASLLIACLGSTFVVMMGSIDLSVGAIVILTGAIGVRIMNSYGLGLSILPIAALIGGALGLLNGIVYVRGRIQSFVVTLGSLSIFTGVGLNLLDGRAVEFTNEDFGDVAIGQVLPHVPNIALWAVGAWLVVVFVSQRTRFGRYMYLIGGGETVARTAGVPVDRFKVYAFGLSGLMAGLAAILLVARLGSAGPSLGSDLLLDTMAAIVVGGTSLAGGVGGPQRTLIGVLIIAILDNGLNLMGVSEYTQMIVKGAVVIVAVLVSRESSTQAVVK
jgi:ribose/xylose/arabinose/galactoside ABC-type transport system permease subunit